MLDLPNIFAEYTGLFPETEAKNSSGGTSIDGTEFIAELINDGIWGWMQALLTRAGASPSGVVESYDNSQVLDSILSIGKPGEASINFWNDDPANLNIRALQMIGQGILIASYSLLDSVVYCGDTLNPTAEAFYHADDAAGVTRNTAGVYLILPDARGQFLRIADPTGSIDPDGATRNLGEIILDAFQAWQLGSEEDATGVRDYWAIAGTRDLFPSSSGSANNTIIQTGTLSQGNSRMMKAMNDGTNGDIRSTSETRPTSTQSNIALYY